MTEPLETILHGRHVALGAKMVEFGGWRMPLHYKGGIVQEHLAARKLAGVFDVSHMGRFVFRGRGATPLLQHVLVNNALALEAGQSQYTMIANQAGGAIDDAYLYRFVEDEYLLVVNAANRQKDWDHFQNHLDAFGDVEMSDRTAEVAMVSLQGPRSGAMLKGIVEEGNLPEPMRNALGVATVNGARVMVARTGYTGEPVCFELFIEAKDAPAIWDVLIERGACPVGLGARDTLRLEAGLPLYGHELGSGPDGRDIPVFACALARLAVSFSPSKGDFIGRDALARQHEALKRIMYEDYSLIADLPRRIMPAAVAGRGIARAGDKVLAGEKHVGFVTSGTMIPYWKIQGQGLSSRLTDVKGMRPVCLALLDSDLRPGEKIDIEIRGRRTEAVIVEFHLRSEAPPHARPILYDHVFAGRGAPAVVSGAEEALDLANRAIANTLWRQRDCVNLIPSEQTLSPMTRMLSIMDPAFRYAEHKPLKAFYDTDVFYYQGTAFIEEVERLLAEQMRLFLGCREVETRVVSGQMANAAVFSAMVDYLNRADRKREPGRIRRVMNNHIMKGGHLSSQPMGALRDYVARDERTEGPAVVNFPVLRENPYKMDLPAGMELVARYRPELIILGRSVVLHPEPVAEIRALVDELGMGTVIMYDMAHVLGLLGPHFQQPFSEGAHIVTGSTHKTFFGTQRGVIAADYDELEERHHLWEAIGRRVFPGSVSNHHLGTLLGLLMAAYEMNHFKDQYQPRVIANAKAFAAALKRSGLDVAGDPDVSYTQTHQVIVNVGYGRGPEIAARLEDDNVIVNYQASADEEGFTAAGSLRMGVSEMTRFGMREGDFETLAQLIRDAIVDNRPIKDEVKSFRGNFTDLEFRFTGKQFDRAMERLHGLVR